MKKGLLITAALLTWMLAAAARAEEARCGEVYAAIDNRWNSAVQCSKRGNTRPASSEVHPNTAMDRRRGCLRSGWRQSLPPASPLRGGEVRESAAGGYERPLPIPALMLVGIAAIAPAMLLSTFLAVQLYRRK